MRAVQPGSTSVRIYMQAITVADGTNATGIAFNTSGIEMWYAREGGAKTTITPVILAALTTGYTSGGLLHVSDGVFRLDVPNAAFAVGANTVVIGGKATGIVITPVEVQLKYDPVAVRIATATGGAASTITLDASASAGTDFYVGCSIQTISGTGANQSRLITAYNGSTKVATVDRAWATNPASGTLFAILPTPGVTGMTTTEVAAAVLNATATSYNTASTIGQKINASGAAATPPTTTEIRDAMLSATVATGITFGDAIRGFMAVLYGKSTVSGNTRNFRNIEDTKNAISATVDSSNQRTAVSRSLTQ